MQLDINNPATFTAQRIFDYVCIKLAEQAKRSTGTGTDVESKCLYRGPKGIKCSVGHLIPDELYVPEMDFNFGKGGTTVSTLLKTFDSLEHLKPYEPMLIRLQQAHDHSSEAGYLRSYLKAIARDFNLKKALACTITEWE